MHKILYQGKKEGNYTNTGFMELMRWVRGAEFDFGTCLLQYQRYDFKGKVSIVYDNVNGKPEGEMDMEYVLLPEIEEVKVTASGPLVHIGRLEKLLVDAKKIVEGNRRVNKILEDQWKRGAR